MHRPHRLRHLHPPPLPNLRRPQPQLLRPLLLLPPSSLFLLILVASLSLALIHFLVFTFFASFVARIDIDLTVYGEGAIVISIHVAIE